MEDYSSQETIYRILRLQAENGVLDKDLAKALKVTGACISGWRVGRGAPKSDTIYRASKFFGVSADFLLTGKETATDLMKVKTIGKQEFDLLERYRRLPVKSKQLVENFAESLYNAAQSSIS